MPPKNHRTGTARHNVMSTRVDDELAAEVRRRIGKKRVSVYLQELIEQDINYSGGMYHDERRGKG